MKLYDQYGRQVVIDANSGTVSSINGFSTIAVSDIQSLRMLEQILILLMEIKELLQKEN